MLIVQKVFLKEMLNIIGIHAVNVSYCPLRCFFFFSAFLIWDMSR